MAYVTRDDIEAEIGADILTALADLDNDGIEDAGVVDSAIAGADALINSYASKRFAVPFNPPSPTITDLAIRLAIYGLRRKKQALTAQDIAVNADDRLWLKALADGDVLPGVEPLPPKGSIMRDVASPRPSAKDVSRAKLKGFT